MQKVKELFIPVNEVIEDLPSDVYLGYVNDDSPLYIDITKMAESDIPEFQNAIFEVKNRLNHLKNLEYSIGIEEFHFEEPYMYNLGICFLGDKGKGLNGKTAREVYDKIHGRDETFYESLILKGYFIKNIGIDRMCDLVGVILRPDFFNYTKRVLTEVGFSDEDFSTQQCKIFGLDFSYPTISKKRFAQNLPDEPLVLIPNKLLSVTPPIITYDDIFHLANDFSNLKISLGLPDDFKKKDVLSIKQDKIFRALTSIEEDDIFHRISSRISTASDSNFLYSYELKEIAMRFSNSSNEHSNLYEFIIQTLSFYKLEILPVLESRFRNLSRRSVISDIILERYYLIMLSMILREVSVFNNLDLNLYGSDSGSYKGFIFSNEDEKVLVAIHNVRFLGIVDSYNEFINKDISKKLFVLVDYDEDDERYNRTISRINCQNIQHIIHLKVNS